MTTNHKVGRSLGGLFGHDNPVSSADISLNRDEAGCDTHMGVTIEDVVWDPEGRILNWKSVVNKIQKQVWDVG